MRSRRRAIQIDVTFTFTQRTDRRRHRLSTVCPAIGTFSVTPTSVVRDLGVYIDLDLSMRSHVSHAVLLLYSVNVVSQR